MQKNIEQIRKKAPRYWTQEERQQAFTEMKKKLAAEESKSPKADSKRT
jgi:hypothetical protein